MIPRRRRLVALDPLAMISASLVSILPWMYIVSRVPTSRCGRSQGLRSGEQGSNKSEWEQSAFHRSKSCFPVSIRP